MRHLSIVYFFLIFFSIAGCSSSTVKSDSLFQRLGGEIGVDQLVVTTLQLVRENEDIAFHFEDIDDANLTLQLYMFICHLTGGECVYEGLDMVESHAGMEITKSEFDIFVEVFMDAMKKNNIAYSAQNQLLAILAPMRSEIIHQ